MMAGLSEAKRKPAKEKIKNRVSALKECSSYAVTGHATGKSNAAKCLGLIAMAEPKMIEVSDQAMVKVVPTVILPPNFVITYAPTL
jgi:hypothetical protein